MNDFFQRVYKVVAMIPAGKVATYGQIAALLGNPLAARMVGEAVRRTPLDLDIPCHRVVSRSGVLAPDHVFGGSTRQRGKLAGEGVIFKEDGRIDMRKSLWKPDFLSLP
jgi:methylated-DNA-protein-cysteine methyltransferase-like protein